MPLIKESTDFKNSYEEITDIQKLINLLEEADNDVKNGNFLSEEEMDREMDLL
jgi:hypothetical protein